jgi:hypothetical protein
MINSKASFERILREWGHNVHIQRRLSNNKYSERFERVTTRHVGQSGVSNSLSMDIYEEGLEAKHDIIYYFQANVNPKQGDRIYENYSSRNRNYSIFIIENATPIRGRLGKILFWTVGAKREK